MERYYVYIYLDTRKPGNYTYGDLHFEYLPIYIGKGCRSRITHHLQDINRKKKTLFYNKLNKIINDGYEPIYFKFKEKLCEKDALDLEIKLISMIGRIDLETGPLCNFTEGGEIGFTRSIESRKKLSLSKMGDKNPMFGKTTSDKQKLAVSISSKKPRPPVKKEHCEQRRLKRLGSKNTKKRKDTIIYELILKDKTVVILHGAKNVAKYCKDNKLKYWALMLNKNVLINSENVNGKYLHAKNTIGCQLNKIKNEL